MNQDDLPPQFQDSKRPEPQQMEELSAEVPPSEQPPPEEPPPRTPEPFLRRS